MAASDASSETAVERLPEAKRRRTLPWQICNEDPQRVLAQRYKGAGTLEDPYIVEWLEDDAENPRTFSQCYKWFQIWQASLISIPVVWGSSSYGGISTALVEQFNASSEVATLGITSYVIALVFGPLLWAPVSEVLGRRTTTIATFSASVLFQGVAVSSRNIQSVIIYRFWMSFFGSSILTNAGGLSGDMLDATQRGLGLAAFSACAFLGPPLGPMIAGWLDFVWQERLLTIWTAGCTLSAILLMTETYAPVLLRRRAAWLEKHTGRVYRAPIDAKGKVKFLRLLKTSLSRPWIITLCEPIVLCISAYLALVYAVFYLFLAAFPILFQELRGWSPGIAGQAFAGILVGILIGTVHLWLDNRRYVKQYKQHNGNPPPEIRLPPTIFASIMFTVGLAWFAGTCGPVIFWLVPIIATVLIGWAYILLFITYFSYLIDSYVLFAASVLAGQSATRSIVAAAFPTFTIPMYATLGPNWASSIPAFLSILGIPLPIIFYLKGAEIRKRSKFAAKAAEMLEAVQMQASAKPVDDEKFAAATAEGKLSSDPTV